MSVSAGTAGLQARLGIDTSGLGQQLAQGAVQGARAAGTAIGQALMNALNGATGSVGNAGTAVGQKYADNILDGATVVGGGGIGKKIGKALSSDTAAATAAGTAFGHVMGEAITAAAGKAMELGMGAVTKTLDMGNEKAKLQAQLDLSPEQAARMGKLSGEIYAGNYGESLSQVNDAMRQSVQNGVFDKNATDKEIGDVTKNMLSVGAAFDKDATEVAKAVGGMMRNGLVKNAQEGIDVYVKGLQTGADKAGDLADTFEEYGTQFRFLGLDGAKATALINQGLAAGARNGDLVADAMKEFALKSVDGSKASADGYKALGLNAEKMTAQMAKGGPAAAAGLQTVLDRLRNIKDPVKQSAAAVGLFGTKSEDMQKALLGLNPATAQLQGVAGAGDKVNKTLSDTPGAQIESFKRTLEQGIVNTVGGKVLPILGDFAKSLGLSADSIEPLLAIALPLGGALIGLAAATKAVSIVTEGWSAVTKIATGVQAAFNFVMNLNPAVKIAMVVIALGGALVYLYTHSETARKIIDGLWKGIKDGAAAAWDWIKKVGPAVWDFFKNIISKGVEFIVWWQTLPIRVGKAILDFIVKAATLYIRFQVEFAKFIWSIIKKGADFVGWWVGLPVRIGKAIGGLAGRMYTAATDTVAGFAKGIRDGAHTIIENIKKFITDPIPNFLKSTFDIHSPSRVMAKLFGYLPAGAAVGIRDMAGLAVSAAADMAADVHGAMVLAPPTIAATDARTSARTAAAVSDMVALSSTGGGSSVSKTVQNMGPQTIVTSTPEAWLDEQMESASFAALAPVRG